MNNKRSKTRASPQSEQTVIVVCRGGDCGNRRKHADLDHAQQLAAIRAETAGRATVVVSKCLDACSHSNVIVAIPDLDNQRLGAQPVWLGDVNNLDVTADLIEWSQSSECWTVRPPALIEIHQFTPTRQSRNELEDPGSFPGFPLAKSKR